MRILFTLFIACNFINSFGQSLNIRSCRDESTEYFIDGVRIEGVLKLPDSVIEKLEVITGSLPQNFNNWYPGVNETSEIIHENPVGKYWVYFTDKNNSIYNVNKPGEYLTQKSIDRRTKFDIDVTVQDIPVNKNYIAQIKNTGAEIVIESRWLNAVSVNIFSDEQMIAISQLSFVKDIIPVKKYRSKLEESPDIPYNNTFRLSGDAISFYGASANQFTMINGDFLHNLDYRGEGITIAVIDGGFYGVDNGIGYQSLRDKDQILGVYNFPDNNENVYFSSYHGTWVLGIMAADISGSYVGSAPDANYYLFRSEVVDSERVVEEDYWLAAAEQADFVGADIINSSLGYTTFDDSTENHTYADMDGNTTVVTKAADWAAGKGILVCNSAGNEGDSEWHYIGAPADGDSVFTIGAVDNFGNYASFSSTGPTYDGRIKPNIAVQGANFPILNPDGTIGIGGGTSFASPLAAGAAACLWQAFPEKTNMEIMQAMQKSASQFNDPDSLLGHGIPDLALAYMNLKGMETDGDGLSMQIFPNPVEDDLFLFIYNTIPDETICYIYDISGKKVFEYRLQQSDINYNAIRIDAAKGLASGVYILALDINGVVETEKIFVK
ncbi:MAG: S8 family serine peptidase [Fimbriimonadaceae bacterium]|nr:S8 family serine peptidase [Chitinophagales bacterium]